MFLRERGCQYIQTPGENTIADSKEEDPAKLPSTEIQMSTIGFLQFFVCTLGELGVGSCHTF